jgi:hypothetical protein
MSVFVSSVFAFCVIKGLSTGPIILLRSRTDYKIYSFTVSQTPHRTHPIRINTNMEKSNKTHVNQQNTFYINTRSGRIPAKYMGRRDIY